MPWCEECSKYWTPNSMTDEGTCPRCGETITDTMVETADDEKTPWHFKLLVVAVVAYLVWRTIDIFG
jgi:uncharacterized paraquat-inducible protein A